VLLRSPVPVRTAEQLASSDRLKPEERVVPDERLQFRPEPPFARTVLFRNSVLLAEKTLAPPFGPAELPDRVELFSVPVALWR
jgi:hypothetical protein